LTGVPTSEIDETDCGVISVKLHGESAFVGLASC